MRTKKVQLSFEQEAELMKPGKVHKVSFPLYPTGNLFKKGHRIRVDISSSNFPHFDVNPNTGEPEGKSLRKVVAENSVYHDPDHPSHVVLPVIPTGRGISADVASPLRDLLGQSAGAQPLVMGAKAS